MEAPAARREMFVNPTGLRDGEVRTLLLDIAQAITLKAQTSISKAEQQGGRRKNPLANIIASRLRHIMRMNPFIILDLRLLRISRRSVRKL